MFNNKTKMFLLLTLVFIAILGVSAATAADIDNNAIDTSSIAQETITETSDVEISDASDNNVNSDVSTKDTQITKNTLENAKSDGEGTFTDLESELSTSSDITLSKDYKCSVGESSIAIHGTKIIDGAGYTISDVTKGLFVVATDGDLTIKNLKVVAGESTTADVIALNGKLTCENVIFDMSKSTRAYYAIVSYATDGSQAKFTNCVFENFNATGCVDLYRKGTVDLDGCNFTNVTSSNSPVKLWKADSNATIKNSRFVDCIGANHGAAICPNNYNQNILIDNCYFENCLGVGSGVIAVQAQNTTVTNSVFKNNKNTGTGSYSHGAICVRNGNAVLYTSNNVMDDPEVQDAEIYVYSGKVNKPYLTGENIIAEPGSDITITYNLTDDNGNSIELPGVSYNLKLNGEYLTASSNRGVISKSATAPTEDGVYPVEISLSDSSMIDGDAVITDAQVQVGNVATDIIITDETYSNFFNDDGTLIEGAIPEGAVAKFDGTFTNRKFNINIPMTIDTGDNPAVFDACTFTLTSDVTFQDVKFTGALADSTPMIISSGNTVFENVDFTDVQANYAEMIRATADSNITMIGSTVENFKGGAIVGPSTNRQARIGLTIMDSNFINNNGTWTPIRINSNNWTVNIQNSNFTDNAGANGGFIQVMNNRHYAKITIDNCNFTGTNATSKAGVIYVAGNYANVSITNSYFANNKVSASSQTNNLAGVIDINSAGSTLYLENNVMESNEASYTNADIYFEAYGTMASPIKIIPDNATVTQYEDVDITVNLTDDMGNPLAYKSGFSYLVFIGDEQVFSGSSSKVETITADYEAGTYPITVTYDDSKVSTVTVAEATLTVEESPLIKYAALQALIDADTTGTVTLEKEVMRGSDEESIVINKDVVLDGNGLSIDARQGRVFDITSGATVTIKNILITNVGNLNVNSYNAEGRFANISSGNVVFENITFKDSEAPDFSSAHGSFIHILPGNTIVIKDSEIVNTTGTFLNLRNATGVISNTLFEGNDATATSAIIANGGNLTVVNSQFIDNKALNSIIYGKAHQMNMFGPRPTTWFTSTSLTVDNTTFVGNAINNWGVIGAESDTTVSNSQFINNEFRANYKGGCAIYSNDGKLTVSKSIFEGNTVRASNEGSIIYNAYGDLDISNSLLLAEGTQASVYNSASGATATANYNYWGTNSSETYINAAKASGITVDNWVVLDTKMTPTENLEFGDVITVTTTLNKYTTDGTTLTDLTDSMPDYSVVSYSSDFGSFSEDSVEMKDGVATTQYTVKSATFEITASYPYEENVLTGTSLVEPKVYVLNDGNWTEYFNEDGTVNEDVVIPNSELRFEGVFNERDMYITIPLNLTTAETQAVLNNCTFTVIADNVNITDIEMNDVDYAPYLISVLYSNNVLIENNTLSLTNNVPAATSHTIEVLGGSDNVIRNNIITTVVAESAVVYNYTTGDMISFPTASIHALASNNIVIDTNLISTKPKDETAEQYGTIYGIFIRGNYNAESPLTGAEIVNNEIITDANVYAYGVNVDYVDDITVENNNVTTTGTNYADGIQVYSITNSKINANKIVSVADNYAYGIIVNGKFDWNTYYLYMAEGNYITDNVIVCDADTVYMIELYITTNNTVSGNNLTADVAYPVGIATCDSSSNIIQYNNINLTATMDKEVVKSDMIDYYPAGIKISVNPSYPMASSDENEIQYNNVTITSPEDITVPAVNLTSDKNIVTDNYLVSTLGLGDEAVLDEGEDNTVENNIPPFKTVITIDEIGIVNVGDEISITGKLTTIDDEPIDGTVIVTVNGESSYDVPTAADGTYECPITVEVPGVNEVTVTYEATEYYSEASQEATFIAKRPTSIDYYVINDIEGKVAIEFTVLDENDEEMDGAQVILSGDVTGTSKSGRIYKNKDLTEGTYTITVSFEETEEFGASEITMDLTVQRDPSEVIAELNDTINDMNDTINDMNDTINDMNDTINDMNDTINDMNDTINNLTEEIDNLNAPKETIISIDPLDDIKYNDVILISGTLTTEDGLGIDNQVLTITINDTPVEVTTHTGSFEYVTQIKSMGEKTVTVTYEGSDNYVGTESAIVFDVAKQDVVITVDPIEDVMLNDNVTITGTFTDANGAILSKSTVHVTYNGVTTRVVTDENGVFTYTAKANPVGENEVTLAYGGYEKFNPYEITETFNVLKRNAIITIDPIKDAVYKDTVTITGTFKDANGKALGKSTLQVTINGRTSTVKTDENGVFTITTAGTTIGENNITVAYAGYDKYNEVEANATFIVNKKDVMVTVSDIVVNGTKISITGKFTDADGNILTNSKVMVTLNGKKAYATTDSEGVYQFTGYGQEGQNTFTVGYYGTNNYNAYTSSETKLTVSKS